MATKLDVIPPLEEWDINLEVSSQVYQLLKGFEQLQGVNGLTVHPYRAWEGLRIKFEKTLPQVVMAPYSLRNCSSGESK